MSWDECKVILNSTNGYFCTGGVVTGTVSLEFKTKRKIKDLTFKVIGTSQASWTRSAPTIPYIKIYSEKSKLLYITIDVFRDINGKIVQPGIINVPFHFALPPDLPSSFKDSIAKIFYYIVVKSKIAYKIKRKLIHPLKIVSTLNLNDNSDYIRQSLFEVIKTRKHVETFSLIIRTYKGAAVKQRLPFEAIINNERKIKITRILVTFNQKLEYCVASGYYNTKKKIDRLEIIDFKSSLRETKNFYMIIPDIQPSTINLTNTMVNISYELDIEVCFRFHCSVTMNIPIVVGSTPVIYPNYLK